MTTARSTAAATAGKIRSRWSSRSCWSARGCKPGSYGDVQQVDVAPTLAVLLGAAIPATAQGRVLSEMLALQPSDHGRRPRIERPRQPATVAAAYGAP